MRLLIIDDDPATLAVVQETLTSAGMDVVAVRTAEEGDAALARERVSLVLLALAPPDADGRTVASRLVQSPHTAGIPVLMLSPAKHEGARLEARRLGLAGWLDKPVDPAALLAAVTEALRSSAAPAADPDRESRSGTASRGALARAYAQATAPGSLPSAVILVDLDNLAAINASGGTSTGDEVLRGVGVRLTEAFRESDLVARWRDDEFALLLPATDVATAKRLLARAQAHLTTSTPTGPDGAERPVTFSAGIGVALPPMPLDAAIAAADRALSLAKASGPSTVRSEEDDRPTDPVSVLIAEDDRVSATLARHRLERAGYRVTHCLDGKDALAAAEAGTFGLFILDIRMPGMDGIELLKRLRATEAYARTPIVMLTSVGREEDIVRAFDLGASDYVTKPFSPVELLARAQRLVREHAAGPAR